MLVEVLGWYSNYTEQGIRIDALLVIVLPSSNSVNSKTIKQVQRRLPPDEIERMIAAYKHGATVYEVAQEYRINRQTVSAILERKGVPRRRQSLSPSQIAVAVERYQGGQSAAVIAAELGCDPGTVRLALIKAGVRMRDSQGKAKSSEDSVSNPS